MDRWKKMDRPQTAPKLTRTSGSADLSVDSNPITNETHRKGKFFNAVKAGMLDADPQALAHMGDGDEKGGGGKLTPLEKHAAKIHDLLHRDSKALPPDRTIHSFTELVSRAMLAAHAHDPPEVKIIQPSKSAPKFNKNKTSGALRAEEAAAKRMSKTAANLSKVTHFTKDEVEGLMKMFWKFTSRSKIHGQMDRDLFREVFQTHFGIRDDVMLDHMFFYFDEERTGYIVDTQWVTSLSTLLRGTIQEHIEYCYEVYKLGAGTEEDVGIRRPQLRQLLGGCLGVGTDMSEDDHGSKEIIDLAIRRLGRITLGYITLESFTNAVVANPLNIQALGACLPDLSRLKTFMAMFSEEPSNFRCNYSLPNDPSYKGKKFLVMIRKRKA